MLFAPIRLLLKLIYFAVLASVVYVVVSGVQVVSASHLPTTPTAAGSPVAIVVLGAPVVGDGPGADLLARLEQARLLYGSKVANRVIVTGPAGSGSAATETAVARTWLIAHDVAASAIAPMTAPNAATGLSLIDTELGGGSKRVVVVTDAIDALWVRNAAGKTGLDATVSPAQGSERPVYNELGQLWREATGVALGRLIGYSHTTWAAS